MERKGLLRGTMGEVANRLNVTRQTAWNRFNNGNYPEVLLAVAEIEGKRRKEINEAHQKLSEALSI